MGLFSRSKCLLSCRPGVSGCLLLLAAIIGPLSMSTAASQEQKAPMTGVHPATPQPEREQKSALTEAISRHLPPAARAEITRKNYIDDYIFGKMECDHIPHALLASDLEFIRRVYLDLTGRIPEPEAI